MAQFLFVCFFPKLVRLLHTLATVTLYKQTQVFTILMFILQVVGSLSYALRPCGYLGGGRRRWVKLQNVRHRWRRPGFHGGRLNHTLRPHFRPHYLIRRNGCLWPDSLHWEHDNIRQDALKRLLKSVC